MPETCGEKWSETTERFTRTGTRGTHHGSGDFSPPRSRIHLRRLPSSSINFSLAFARRTIHFRQWTNRRRHFRSADDSSMQSGYGTVTTTFPTCAFDSRYLYASTVCANGKVFAIFG